MKCKQTKEYYSALCPKCGNIWSIGKHCVKLVEQGKEAGTQETLKQVEEMFDKCIFKLNVSGEVWVKICELKSQISKLKLNSQQEAYRKRGVVLTKSGQIGTPHSADNFFCPHSTISGKLKQEKK